MRNFSLRYHCLCCKKYDNDIAGKGSSSLWGVRMAKAFGALHIKDEHNLYGSKKDEFDYSDEQVAKARKFRPSFYERILNPQQMIGGLRYSPIMLDIEIFNSIFYDDGIITLPDEDDKKEDSAHSVTVIDFDLGLNSFKIDTSWPNWGNNGLGMVSMDYLKRYFITAFVIKGFALLGSLRVCIYKEYFIVADNTYILHIYREDSSCADKRRLFNAELENQDGILVGWLHCALHFYKLIEVLDLFIIKEYRRLGLGSLLLQNIKKFLRVNKITGYIAGQDLVGNQEEVVKGFLIKNNLIPISDRTHFYDAKFKVKDLQ